MATDKNPKKNLYQKLLHIQQHIIGLGKDKSAFGYKYVTGDKVLDHIKPLMNEQGILLKQEVISIENVRQDYKTKSGETSEINSKVMMKFTWIDAETGEKDESMFGANGQNAWDKGVGSALTYGERYFLLKFFHIATDEDDIDNPERKAKEKPATDVQLAKIKELINNDMITPAEEEAAHKRLITGFTEDAATKAIAYYSGLIKQRTATAAA